MKKLIDTFKSLPVDKEGKVYLDRDYLVSLLEASSPPTDNKPDAIQGLPTEGEMDKKLEDAFPDIEGNHLMRYGFTYFKIWLLSRISKDQELETKEEWVESFEDLEKIGFENTGGGENFTDYTKVIDGDTWDVVQRFNQPQNCIRKNGEIIHYWTLWSELNIYLPPSPKGITK